MCDYEFLKFVFSSASNLNLKLAHVQTHLFWGPVVDLLQFANKINGLILEKPQSEL